MWNRRQSPLGVDSVCDFCIFQRVFFGSRVEAIGILFQEVRCGV